MGNNIDASFDWVTARNSCSVGAVFEKLRLDVKTDVEKRQQLRERNAEFGFLYGFTFASNFSKFSASIERRDGKRHSIIFVLMESCIVVVDENDKELFSASVTVNNDKECVVVVGDEELEQWQFRKKALETLFFPND